MGTDFGSEIRHAVRALLRAPALTFAGVLCLGLGIGATTAIFSAVHAALLRPLPFPEPDRLVSVFRTTPQFSSGPFAPANYLDLRSATQTVESLVAVSNATSLMEGPDASLRVTLGRAAGDLFGTLGVRPLRGRALLPEDEADDRPPVVVVSEALWRDRFGADPELVGRAIRLDGEEHEVVGIFPRNTRVPHGGQMLDPDLWTVLRFSPRQATARRNNYLLLLGRLRDGVGVEAADAELRRIMDGIVEVNPVLRGEQLRVVPLHRESVRGVRGPLLLLLGAVGFVLLIAAANVASLLLARGVGRAEEYAVRMVLGAGRRDVVRTAMVESLVLSGAGALAGLVLALVGVRVISGLLPARLPQLAGLEVNGPVLVLALVLALIVGAVCGVAPAWQASSGDPQGALRAGGRGDTGSRHQRGLRLLIVGEVALSLVLLLGAGLVIRGFGNLMDRAPGFDPEGLVTVTADVSPARYGDQGPAEGFLLPALEAVRAVPGVRAAGGIHLLPYDNWGWNFNIRYEGQSGEDPTQLPLAETRYVEPGFFEAVRQHLLAGRVLSPLDDASAETVVVANQALADRDFPAEDPVGKRFHLSDTTFATVVGVVANIRNSGPYSEPRPAVYFNYAQQGQGFSNFPLLVRVTGEPASFAVPITDAIHAVDPTAAVSQLRTMDQVRAQSVGTPRFYLALIAVFAGVALALAVAGLYGVMSYAVARRTREIGIRSALGASPGRVFTLVLGQAVRLMVVGSLVGLPAGFAVTRLLGTLLYGVSPLDALAWLLAPLPLVVTALLAAAVPARRASVVAPQDAMRAE